MDWSALAALAELFAAAAVVVSLLYLSAQVRSSTRQAQRDAARDLAQGVIDVSLALGSSSDLSRIFMIGMGRLDELSPLDQVRFRTVCNAWFRALELQFLMRQQGTLDDESWRAVDAMLRDFAALSGIQQYFADRSEWYTSSFMDYLKEDAGLRIAHSGRSLPETYVQHSDAVAADST